MKKITPTTPFLASVVAIAAALAVAAVSASEIVCDAPVPEYVPMDDKNAKLEAVVSVSRHGDRAPLYVLPNEHNEDGVEWDCGAPAFLNSIPMGSVTGNSGSSPYGEFKQNYEAPPGIFGKRIWKGTCGQGQLSEKGAKQCYNMGKAFRSIYIDRLGLLPDEYDPEKLYVQSTDTSARRTQQSLMSMMYGFYPPEKRGGKVVVMNSNSPGVEIFKPNSAACPRISEITSGVRSSAEYLERRSAIDGYLYELNTIEGTHGSSTWDKGVVEPWGDSLLTRLCNNKPFHCNSTSGHCLGEDAGRAVIDFYNYDNAVYLASEEAGKLGGGYVVRYAYERLAARAYNGTGYLYTHISAHDTTLIGTLSALRHELSGLPPYASTLIFELWKTSAGEHVVRTLFNTVPIAPPECNGLLLCPLADYRKMIEDRLTVNDYESECALKSSNKGTETKVTSLRD